MRTLILIISSLVTISLTTHASPSDAMKSFLNSNIEGKSVKEVFCKWDDHVAVTDADVAKLKDKLLILVPQLGIPALQNLAGLTASDLEVTGSTDCSQSLQPKTFSVAVRKGFSIRVFINDAYAQETYKIVVHNLSSENISKIYQQTVPHVNMGLGLVIMENVVKLINENVVPLQLQPRNISLDNINGVEAIQIDFADIAKAGELHSLLLMADGTLMAMNQLNVELNSTSDANIIPDVTYKIIAVARCICVASMVVKDENGQGGHILDKQKVSSILVNVQNKDVVLENPPDGIRNYYAGLNSNKWVIAELAKKGIKLEGYDSIALISFSGPVTLYTDETGTTPIFK